MDVSNKTENKPKRHGEDAHAVDESTRSGKIQTQSIIEAEIDALNEVIRLAPMGVLPSTTITQLIRLRDRLASLQ